MQHSTKAEKLQQTAAQQNIGQDTGAVYLLKGFLISKIRHSVHGPPNDFPLLLFGELHKIYGVPRHTDRELWVAVWVLHGIEQHVAVEHVDVDVVPALLEVSVQHDGQVLLQERAKVAGVWGLFRLVDRGRGRGTWKGWGRRVERQRKRVRQRGGGQGEGDGEEVEGEREQVTQATEPRCGMRAT